MRTSKCTLVSVLLASVFAQDDVDFEVEGSIANTGSLVYDLTIFQDSEFSTVHDQAIHGPFVVGTPLYFRVKAGKVLPGVSFSLLSCQVKNNDESLSYKIIDGLCPDDTVNAQIIGNSADASEITARYNVFEFISDAEIQDTNTIHLSCEVILCDDLDDDSTCAVGCVDGARRKRSPFDPAGAKIAQTQRFSFNVRNES